MTNLERMQERLVQLEAFKADESTSKKPSQSYLADLNESIIALKKQIEFAKDRAAFQMVK